MNTILIIFVIVFIALVLIFKKNLRKAWLKIFGMELGVETHTDIPIVNQPHFGSSDNVAGDKIIYNSLKKDSPNSEEGNQDEVNTLPISVYPGHIDSSSVLSDKFHRCSKCNFGFMIKNDLLGVNQPTSVNRSVFSINKIVTCPKCKNTDNVIYF